MLHKNLMKAIPSKGIAFFILCIILIVCYKNVFKAWLWKGMKTRT